MSDDIDLDRPGVPQVSVVIPAHNASSVIGDQLEALASQVGAPPFEVLVALNCCTDETEAVAQSFDDRLQLSVVRADNRASAAHARNVGAAAASTDVLLFCDADDHVGPLWVTAMADAIIQDGNDFVGGPVVVDREGLPDWAYHQFYEWLDGIYLKPSPDGFERPLGGCLGVTRAAFEEVGGFDESFPGSCEDSDLTLRLLQAGFRVGAAMGAEVTVRPRTTTMSIVRRQQTHAPGGPHLLAKHHRLPRPSGYFAEYRATLRWLAFLTVRRHIWRPSELYARFVIRRANELAMRRAWGNASNSNPGALAPDGALHESDFVVLPGTPVIGGLGFRADAERTRWWATCGVQPRSIGLTARLLREGDRVVDVGAGIGIYAVLTAMLIGPRGQIIAFEPDNLLRACLRENLTRHRVGRTVQVRQTRLVSSSHRGAPERNRATERRRLTASEAGMSAADAADTPSLDVVTLDDSVREPIQFIRLSAGGYEADVLRGAASLLERSPDVSLLIELEPKRLADAGSGVDDLLDTLPPRPWSLWLLDERAKSEPFWMPFGLVARSRLDSVPDDWHGQLRAVPLDRVKEIVDPRCGDPIGNHDRG